jgi:hypothetical protein
MASAPTGFKDIVVIWEEPDKYVGRRTPSFTYTVYDPDDNFPAGIYRNPSKDANGILEEWAQGVDNPVRGLLEFYGDPAYIGIMGSPGGSGDGHSPEVLVNP